MFSLRIQWPEGLKLANNLGFSFPYAQPVPLEKIIPTCSPDGIQLIVDMLKYDPTKRPSAQQILSYPYFQTQEIPKKLGIFENAKNTSDERVALPKKTNKFGDSTTDFLDFLDQKLNENEKTGDRNLENKPRYRQQVKKERKFDDPLSLLEEEKNN
jgi:serine/threonine protein kinase